MSMIRKPILMPPELIELIETQATGDGVSFAESARDLMRRGLSTPDAGATNPFGLDDAMLESLFGEAVDSVQHAADVIDDLMMTLAARDAAETPR